jgi:Uma2 family endonuclease
LKVTTAPLGDSDHPVSNLSREGSISMAVALTATIAPDRVLTLEIRRGMLEQFHATLAEGGPLFKCFEGSATFVSPGETHEITGRRLVILILAVCAVFKIAHTSLASTYFQLPKGAKDTGYEPDEGYYIQSHATADEGQVPDLAIEIVVSHSEKKALACGAILGIPELWVLDIPRHRLTFHHLVKRGKNAGSYMSKPNSKAFPFLSASEVLERLDDADRDATTFDENCREWAAHVLFPRR